jgi:hypothetical protein
MRFGNYVNDDEVEPAPDGGKSEGEYNRAHGRKLSPSPSKAKGAVDVGKARNSSKGSYTSDSKARAGKDRPSAGLPPYLGS